jgi:hypothetical protein
MTIKEIIIEQFTEDEPLVFLDGFDEAIIGVNVGGTNVIYSFVKGIEILEENMTNEEALDYFYFNVASLQGENMPIWVYDNYA